MKYSDKNKPLQCIMTNSTCYKESSKSMTVKGVLWHSTGANNPNIKRYVQPSSNDANYTQLMNLLGKNTAGNDWNHIYHKAGVNAWIGKLADGTVTTVQTLPWSHKPWGCGSGKYGSCNNGWIQFEICEDALTDKNYFDKVYREACELTAYLCKMYNINPLAKTTCNGVQCPTILCHQDSYRLGLGGNHGDVLHWFPKFGKSMDDVRNDVYKIMNEEEEEVTQEQFEAMLQVYLNKIANQDPSSWSSGSRTWAEGNGLIKGDDKGKKRYHSFITREEMVEVLKRYDELK